MEETLLVSKWKKRTTQKRTFRGLDLWKDSSLQSFLDIQIRPLQNMFGFFHQAPEIRTHAYTGLADFLNHLWLLIPKYSGRKPKRPKTSWKGDLVRYSNTRYSKTLGWYLWLKWQSTKVYLTATTQWKYLNFWIPKTEVTSEWYW